MILVWLQREFRLSDFPALAEALEIAKSKSQRVIFAYLHDPSLVIGDANSLWLSYSLLNLQEEIRGKGGELWMLEGSFADELTRLVKEHQVTQVFYTYQVGEPFFSMQNLALKVCKANRIALRPFNSEFLIEAHKIRNQQDNPYLVFTPFYKALIAKQHLIEPINQPLENLDLTSHIKPNNPDWLSLPKTLQTIQTQAWAKKMLPQIEAKLGESKAWQNLQDFINQSLEDYPKERDFPFLEATSNLSANLHFGEISPRSIFFYLQVKLEERELNYGQVEPWLRQLVWREFARHLLVNFPTTETQPFQVKYQAMSWELNAEYLRAWQQGKTGIPIVDAGMRELWHTGTMHNRVRMLVASFLTKNLNQSWLLGKRWFDDTLFDADPANNAMGWQWVAGCGVDAAPYYRLFNPVTQSIKFDSEGKYIKIWLPELTNLSSKAIHSPWEHQAEAKAKHIILGETYPFPLVDLKESREKHLARIEFLKGLN